MKREPSRGWIPVRGVAASLVVALALGAAGAEPVKKPKEADLGAKKSIAPDAALGGSLAAKKKEEGPAGPTLSFDRFRRGIEVSISTKRREEIAGLQKLIRLGGGSAEETPGWYFRLAELLWEESQYYFFEANRRDDRLIELGTRGDPKEIDQLTDEKKALEAEQDKLQAQAVALYKAIIQRYPRYPRLDEVLYFLAQNLQKRNRNDPEALRAYRALIQNYPKSRFVPDSWMAFGEFYFERANKVDRARNLQNALESYRNAAQYPESSVYGYALYKQGWVYYNLTKWSEALELFRTVIFFGEMPTSTVAQDRKLALVREARKDYVRTYSHVGSAERAYDEFRRVGGEANWWDMLKTLAGLYFDEGQDRDAVLVYARLIREKPLSVEAPFFQSHIVTCVARMGRKDAAVQQAHAFAKLLRDVEASPEGKDPKNAKFLADARADAERTLRILAVQYHNEWKKTRDEPVAGYAAAIYRDYLDLFPNDPPAYEMRFFHAELLYALGQFEEAGAEYEKVSQADIQAQQNGGKPGKFMKDALENAVFAYDVVASKQPKVQPGDAKKRIPFSPARQKLLDACERYLKYSPGGDKWVEVAYKAARLYYDHNAFGEASDLFTRIALDHPKHELARYSANLVLDAYNLLGDWRNVNGWAKRFYANKVLLEAHPELKDELARVIEESAFKVIEERERAKDWDAATDEYLGFSRDWPTSHLASTALYNASVDQVRAGRLDRAMEIRDQFLRRYPNDPLSVKCLYDNAEAYEAIGDFAEAADRYERYFAGWRRASQPEPRAAARPAKGKKGRATAPAGPRPGRHRRQAGLRGEEGQRRHHQRGRVPGRAARLGPRRGRQPGLPPDLARRRRRPAHLPLPGGPVPPARADAEGARAARGVPEAVRQGPRRVARHPGSHGQALREGRERSPGPASLRAGPRLLPPARGGREGPGIGAGRAGRVPGPGARVRCLRADHVERLAQVPQGPAPGEGQEAGPARSRVREDREDEAGRARHLRPVPDRPGQRQVRPGALRQPHPRPR